MGLILRVIRGLINFLFRGKEEVKGSSLPVEVINKINEVTSKTYKEVEESKEEEIEEVSRRTSRSIDAVRVSESGDKKRDILRERIRAINKRNEGHN